MKFIEQSVELIPQPTTLKEAYKLAELAGRVSYMSHDSTTEDSYKKFIYNMKKNKHLSVLEFTPVYVKISDSDAVYYDLLDEITLLYSNQYSKCSCVDDVYYISTNYRVIIENELERIMKYWTPPTEYHTKRVMFKLVTNRGVSAECNRHRKNSILESSTRYCNYSKDKFGNELTFTYPSVGFNKNILEQMSKPYAPKDDFNDFPEYYLLNSLATAEDEYMNLTNKGVPPQYVRHVLPLLTATTLYHSAFEDDWQHFIELRSAKNAHPDIQFIANEIAKYI